MIITMIFMLSYHTTQVTSEQTPIRIINELPSDGYMFGHQQQQQQQQSDVKQQKSLPLRMKPAHFTGPEHLRELSGKCFKNRDQKYEYMLCPFHNITQEDIESYYEPYKGILGVWSDWTIENNKFVAMNMIEGSMCASASYRSTKVMLLCGANSELIEVTEPEKCKYLAKFKTPLVCGENAMVVYPRLSEELRKRWDEVEQDKHDGYLTEKGLKKELEAIFIKAGVYLSPDLKKSLFLKVTEERNDKCKESLEAALQRIRDLEEELKLKEDYYEKNKEK